MIDFYARTWQTADRSFLAVRYWLATHRWAGYVGFIVLFQIYAFSFGNAAIAHAADGATPFMPPGWGANDTSGIPVGYYSVLPLDRGNWAESGKTVLAVLTDPFWVFNLFVISWALWLYDFILSFAWVDLIATPFAALADLMEMFFTRFAWIPFALMIAGLLGGIAIVMGKIGSGVAEMSIAVVIAVLAVLVYTNPVKALNSADGLLDIAQETGAQLSAMIVYDDIDQIELHDQDLSDTVTAPLVDLLLRDPTMTLAFGKVLGPNCSEVFNEAMLEKPPLVDTNYVRDEVNDCDEDAKDFNENPNFGQVLSVSLITQSSLGVFLVPLVLAFLFFFTIFGLLLAGVKAPFLAHIAILPYMRRGLFRVTLDLVTGLFSIIILCVGLAASLKLITVITQSIDAAFQFMFDGNINYGQFPVARAFLINLLMLVALIFLIRLKIKAKKAGRSLADQLATMGMARGGKTGQRGPMGAAGQMMSTAAGQIAGHFGPQLIGGLFAKKGAAALAGGGQDPAAASNPGPAALGPGGGPSPAIGPGSSPPPALPPGSSGGSSSGGGPLALPPGPSGGDGGGKPKKSTAERAGQAVQLAKSGGKIAAGFATGGPAGAAVAGAKEVGGHVAKKALAKAASPQTGGQQSSPSMQPQNGPGATLTMTPDGNGNWQFKRPAPNLDTSHLASRRDVNPAESAQKFAQVITQFKK